MLACSLFHEGVSNPTLSRVGVVKNMEQYSFRIDVCQMCTQPDCLAACPSGALVMDERGVVQFVYDDCLICGLCADSCPHNAIFFDPLTDRYMKCDLCAGRVQGPLCVELCPVGALTLEEV